jgi:hypothetical protein
VNVPGFIISNSLGKNLLAKVEKYWAPGPDADFDLPKPSEKGVIQYSKRSGDEPPWIKVTIYHVSERANMKSVLMMVSMIVSIFLLAALLGSLLMHFQMWRQQRQDNTRQRLSNTDEVPNLPPIDAEFIKRLPKINYTSSGGNATCQDEKGKAPIELDMPVQWANKTCPVCLEEFIDQEQLLELPCGHYYHHSCIIPWLMNRSPCCPLCKIDSRVGPANAMLIQMGKSPVLPKPETQTFCSYYFTNCWQMMQCHQGNAD